MNMVSHVQSKNVTFDYVRTLLIYSEALIQNLIEPNFLVNEETGSQVRLSFESSLRDALGGELAVQQLQVRDSTER